MERGERDLRVIGTQHTVDHTQTCDTRKCLNPTILFCVCCRKASGALDQQGTRVIRGGVGRIRECRLPRLEGFGRRELDIGEEVLSSARNPRLGDEAAVPECLWFIVQVVDDMIEDFWREGWRRHRGFFSEVPHLSALQRSSDPTTLGNSSQCCPQHPHIVHEPSSLDRTYLSFTRSTAPLFVISGLACQK